MNRVRIQVRFGYIFTRPYSKFKLVHGRIAEVNLTEERSWEDVFANDFKIPLDPETFAVQSSPRSIKKHSLKEGVSAVLKECNFLEAYQAIPIYVVNKINFLQKKAEESPRPSTSKQVKARPAPAVMAKRKVERKQEPDFAWKNTRPTARQRAKQLSQTMKRQLTPARLPIQNVAEEDSSDQDENDYIEPLSKHQDFLTSKPRNSYMDNDQSDNESMVSQFSQFEERRTFTVVKTTNRRITLNNQSHNREDERLRNSMAVVDHRDTIKQRVDNFGRRNLLQIREELLGLMRRDAQYSKWGLVAPSATFFLEQIFQLRGSSLRR